MCAPQTRSFRTATGRSFCLCPTGWLLDSDWKTCRDIDECSDATLCPPAECVNTLGSYRCVPPVSVAELGANDMDIPQMLESCPEGYAYQAVQPQRCTGTRDIWFGVFGIFAEHIYEYMCISVCVCVINIE